MQAVKALRCDAVVMHRDTLRVCREGKRRFRMHYTRKRCTRAAVAEGLCTQHGRSPLTQRVGWNHGGGD